MIDVEISTGAASSLYSTPINCLPVAQTPIYRLRSLLVAEADPAADADAWQAAFCKALRRIDGSLSFLLCLS